MHIESLGFIESACSEDSLSSGDGFIQCREVRGSTQMLRSVAGCLERFLSSEPETIHELDHDNRVNFHEDTASVFLAEKVSTL